MIIHVIGPGPSIPVYYDVGLIIIVINRTRNNPAHGSGPDISSPFCFGGIGM